MWRVLWILHNDIPGLELSPHLCCFLGDVMLALQQTFLILPHLIASVTVWPVVERLRQLRFNIDTADSAFHARRMHHFPSPANRFIPNPENSALTIRTCFEVDLTVLETERLVVVYHIGVAFQNTPTRLAHEVLLVVVNSANSHEVCDNRLFAHVAQTPFTSKCTRTAQNCLVDDSHVAPGDLIVTKCA